MIDLIRGILVLLRIAKSLFAGSLLVAGATALAPAAFAQHVVTDDEAGKLTLDALTATPAPVVHHYHPAVRLARASASHGHHRLYARTAPLVQTVSYHRSAGHAATHGSSHVLGAHRRRRG